MNKTRKKSLVVVNEGEVAWGVVGLHDTVLLANVRQVNDGTEGSITGNPGGRVEEGLHGTSETINIVLARLSTTGEAVVTELSNDDGKTVFVVHPGEEALEAIGGGVVEVESHKVGFAVGITSLILAGVEEAVIPLHGSGLVGSSSRCAKQSALLVLQGDQVVDPETGGGRRVNVALLSGGGKLRFVEAERAVDVNVRVKDVVLEVGDILAV